MTQFTKPLYEIISGAIAAGKQTITYGAASDQLKNQYRLRYPPVGLGMQLGALAALLDSISERSGLVIPPLTSIVVNSKGEPSYGVAPVFVMWLRRRPNTPASTIQQVAHLAYGKEPPAYVIHLAQTETRQFDWLAVPILVGQDEWMAAPPWSAGNHALRLISA
jgi:hypothetical protein